MFFDFKRCLVFYVGLDIHTKRIAFCVLSDQGQLVQRGQVRGLEEVLRILKALPDRFEVCYEASCGYGHYHDLLTPLAARVLVAHPGQLRLIFRAKNKNDRNDAGRLAKLLYLGETPTVHVPSLAEAAWQALRRSPTVRAYFERVQRGDPQRKKIAVVATAHYLVRVMWALLKRGTVWQENAARAQ
jgi:hypothetical protein